jgi:C-terminal processing protease CtpA/Prc
MALIHKTKDIINKIELDLLFTQPAVPKSLVDRYKNIIRRYQNKFEDYLEVYSEKESTFQMLEEQMRDGNGEFKPGSDYFQKKMYYDLNYETRLMFSQLMYFFRLKEDIGLINRLYKEGDKLVIDKFEQLVMCEHS